MPGKKTTDRQVHKYKQHRNTLTQVAATAGAGISERSARRIDDTDALPSQCPVRSSRTREDPLTEVWNAEVVPLLRTDPQLNAVTLLEELRRRHPGQHDTSVLRALQRHMRQWRALHGAERDRSRNSRGWRSRWKPPSLLSTMRRPQGSALCCSMPCETSWMKQYEHRQHWRHSAESIGHGP